MATATQPEKVWTISKLEAIETASGAELPANIVPANTAFDLRVTFNGSGSTWNAFASAKMPYEVTFYIEGFGTGVEKNVPTPTPYKNNLKVGDNVATVTVPGGLPQGVYQVACLVRIQPGSGVNGFRDDLIMEAA